MAITVDSRIEDILKEKPRAADLLGKYARDMGVTPQMIQLAMGMTIRQVAGYARLQQAKVDALMAELNSL